MTEIKICGITREDDALHCIEAGAAALGFVFYPQSPRYVSPKRAREIAAVLPREAVTVGVFVNEKPDKVKEVYREASLGLVQLHGEESPDYMSALGGIPVVKTLFRQEDLAGYASFPQPLRAFLVDTRGESPGGTGRASDWPLARSLARSYPTILAGGINPDNVTAALDAVRPQALDVNSGVEESPGKKDHGLVTALMKKIKQVKITDAGPGRIFIPGYPAPTEEHK